MTYRSINPQPGPIDRALDSFFTLSRGAGRLYRNEPLNQPGDTVSIPNYQALNKGNIVRNNPGQGLSMGNGMNFYDNGNKVTGAPIPGQTFVDDGSVLDAYQRNQGLVMGPPQPEPVLAANGTGPGVLSNPATPATPMNRRDQTPMSFRPAVIDENERAIRVGLAGLGANGQGATATLGAMGKMYGAIDDANRNALNQYNLAMAKAEAKANAKGKPKGNAGNLASSFVVNDAIDRGLPMISNWTAGLGGQLLSNLAGTDAKDLSKLIDTVKANAGFDKLQAMREASPTGGALGQVSDKEIRFLQSVFGSLDQDQSPDQLRYNLQLFQYVYNSMIHGEGNHPYQPPAGSEGMIGQMRAISGQAPSQPQQQYSPEDQALIDKWS